MGNDKQYKLLPLPSDEELQQASTKDLNESKGESEHFLDFLLGRKWRKLIVEDIQKKAEEGDADAQNTLGVCYYYGIEVPQSYKMAIIWFRKSASQEFLYACHNLCVCYHNGDGVKRNLVLANKWYMETVRCYEKKRGNDSYSWWDGVMGSLFYSNGSEVSDKNIPLRHFSPIGIIQWNEFECNDLVELSDKYLSVDFFVNALASLLTTRCIGLGRCHIYWRNKQIILKNFFGIDWRSPSEMNPNKMYD